MAAASTHPVLATIRAQLGGHRLLLVIAVVCFLVAWNRGINLLYGMVALVLALWLASWLLPLLPLRSVQVSARQSGQAHANGQVSIEYRLRSHDPLAMCVIEQSLPFVSTSHIESTDTENVNSETTESGIARRTLAWWTTEERPVIQVATGQRGLFELTHVRVGCSWPFGLKTHFRTVPLTHCQLLIEPEIVPITAIPATTAAQPQPMAPNPIHSSAALAHNEYAGIRDYRHGDSLRHVHWAASARHQQMMVREFDSISHQDFLLVLDADPASNLGPYPRCSFEHSITIATAMMYWAQQNGVSMRLVCGGQHPFDVAVGGNGRGQQGDYLMALTQAKPWQTHSLNIQSYASVIGSALTGANASTLILIRNQSQLTQVDVSRLPLASGTSVLDIQLCDASFDQPMQQWPEGWQSEPDTNPNRRILKLHASSRLQRWLREM